jgi:two-component system, OmpR family, phosphate regulon sensor histidine kinase PhoR
VGENLIRKVVISGIIAIIGIIAVQSYWLRKTWDIRDNDFDRSVHIALRNVAQLVANSNKSVLPKYKLIERRSSNVYVVNVNSKIRDFRKLEKFLIQEIENVYINTDFEYAVYDCASSEMIYGNYLKMDKTKNNVVKKSILPKFGHLDYYFVVKFPERQSYVINNLWTNIFIVTIAILSLISFLYSFRVILKQKKLSDLQKDFINNMTHEFKTPISSIKIAADVMNKDEGILSNPRLSRYASIIKDQNDRLNDQVEKVLNIARLEKETLNLSMEPININELLTTVVESNRLKFENGKIDFIEEVQKAYITADKLHLTNVIYNIIDNAVKYCQKDPHIKIKLSNINNELHVAISDNGIGISKENIKNLFDKFYRVNTGNIHNVKGFGLGLFYVKSICQAHNWDIHVDSQLDVGTTMDINMKKFTIQKSFSSNQIS